MKQKTRKCEIVAFSIIIELLIIGVISIATKFEGPRYHLFYNLGYGILLSTLVPLLLMRKENEGFDSVGVKKVGMKEIIIILAFDIFSVPGQLMPLIANHEAIRWNLLPICIVPLIMTTFFEEFLFRGFIQTRVEKSYGWVVALLISGAVFSLYHLGYPGFRRVEDIVMLFVVGVGFACSYKLSGNNLIVSYFVNLPNAFIKYIVTAEQFPNFYVSTSIYSAVTIVLVIILLVAAKKREWK